MVAEKHTRYSPGQSNLESRHAKATGTGNDCGLGALPLLWRVEIQLHKETKRGSEGCTGWAASRTLKS